MDCQSTLDMIGSTLGGGSAYSAKFHAVLEDSIKQHFPGNALINCMCHSTNNLYRCTTATLLFSRVGEWLCTMPLSYFTGLNSPFRISGRLRPHVSIMLIASHRHSSGGYRGPAGGLRASGDAFSWGALSAG